MNYKNMIIDCDPGIDDAVAICLAAANQDALRLHGIVSVSGNQVIERVTANACKLAAFFGLDVPVAQGAAAPLIRKVEAAADVHGKSGLGNCELPETDKKTVDKPGILFLYETIMGLPEGEKMILVPTGPLTNIALLFKTFPDVKERVEEIVFMGGAAIGGNVTPTAEFNIWADPEAAAIVAECGVPMVMCGLDVTNRSGLDRGQVDELIGSGKRVAKAVGEMLDFYFRTAVYEGCSKVAIHDAVTVMYLLHPELYTGKKMHMTVDCSEGLNRGMTVCDSRTRGNAEWPLVNVLVDTDEEAFQKLLLEAVYSFD